MSHFLTLGAAQFASQTGDIEANLAKHREFIAQAKCAGVDNVIFPDLSLVGHYRADRLLDVAMP